MKRYLLVLLVVLAPVAYWLWTQVGYQPLPEPLPTSSVVHQEGYESLAGDALSVLRSAREELQLPSISAAIALRDQLIWTGSIGWQDVESAAPASSRTRYRIGSTSKSLTATVAARLVDAGKLDLDEPISTWYADPPNREWRDLTPRQLMSHTAGLPGYEENTDIAGLWRSMMLQKRYGDVEEPLAEFDSAGLLFEPGTSFHYSSFDVNLMAAVLQRCGQQPFLDQVSKLVKKPLGLDHTFADQTPSSEQDVATFYESREGTFKPWRDVNLTSKWPSGGFLSTPADLVKLGAAWLDPSFVSVETRETFWTPQRLTNGEVNPQRYAIGWRSDSTEINGVEYQRRHHGGVSKGSMNWLVVYPGPGVVVDMAINARAEEFSDFARYEKELTALFLLAMASAH